MYFAGQEDRIVLDKQKTLGENLREVLNVTCRPEDDSQVCWWLLIGWYLICCPLIGSGWRQGGCRQEAWLHGGHGQAAPADSVRGLRGREVRSHYMFSFFPIFTQICLRLETESSAWGWGRWWCVWGCHWPRAPRISGSPASRWSGNAGLWLAHTSTTDLWLVHRYLVRSREDASAVTQVNLHHLIVRSLDLDPDSRAERVQAIKLARQVTLMGDVTWPQW